jgi:polyhydroxyalkanoate synthase
MLQLNYKHCYYSCNMDKNVTQLEQVTNFCNHWMHAVLKVSEGWVKCYDKIRTKDQVSADPLNLQPAFRHACREIWENPAKMAETQLDLAKSYLDLFGNVVNRMLDGSVAPICMPDAKDRRFQDPVWQQSPLFAFIRQSYNLNANWLMKLVHGLQTLDMRDAKKIEFYTKFLIDALAPTNFLVTNPEAIKEAFKTQGVSLLKGMENLYHDLARSEQGLLITTADTKAFQLGNNLAITPGRVVYENELMQLIKYEPTTKKVYSVPLIIMPAWINKYYILDLQPHNSLVKWLVDQGYTVFMMSWVNPDARHVEKDFLSYLQEGPLAAIDAVKQMLKVGQVNMMGYCLGGTLLSATIAYLKATHKEKFPIGSATFLTTLVDFAETGDLGIFIDEEQLQALEHRMSMKGYLDGKDMAQTFSMIRANDMIWSFFVNNYLLGRDPFPFDILAWNADSTRLPSKMHSFYLRNMYQNNLLRKPGGINLGGVPIDISLNDLPTYILATQQDHIVPWESAYKATQLYNGAMRFVLSGSGHVAGVVNPPAANKYGYWTHDKLVSDAAQWFKNAEQQPGSWWEDWHKWTKQFSGDMITPPSLDKKLFPESAPGSYVLKS